MNKERFFELMKDTDDELIEMAEEVKPHLQGKRRPWRIFGAAACLCLIAAALAVVPMPHNTTGNGRNEELPTNMDNIIWETGNDNIGLGDTSMTEMSKWHGWNVDWGLWTALEKADDADYLAIVVTKNFNEDAKENFSYNGTTYNKTLSDVDKKIARIRRLESFCKDGHLLKYGELLYTTGTPGGTRWAKELYDARVEYYGELIPQYISNGEFDEQSARSDLSALMESVDSLNMRLNECRESYQELTPEELKMFSSDGMYTSSNCCGERYLFVQKSKLISSNITDRENYNLSLSTRWRYEGKSEDIDVPQ